MGSHCIPILEFSRYLKLQLNNDIFVFEYDSLNMSDEENITNETAAVYHTELKVFHSFEEQELDLLKEFATQSPEQLMKDAVEMILRTYGVSRIDLLNRKYDNLITVKTKE